MKQSYYFNLIICHNPFGYFGRGIALTGIIIFEQIISTRPFFDNVLFKTHNNVPVFSEPRLFY